MTESTQKGDFIGYAQEIENGYWIAYVENHVEITGDGDERTRWFTNKMGEFISEIHTFDTFESKAKQYRYRDTAIEERDTLLEAVYDENNKA